MKRILIIVFWVALVALLLNDGGRYAQSVIHLRTSSDRILDSAAMGSAKLTQAQVSKQIGTLAASEGIRVTQFSWGQGSVTIWTEEDVTGTWVVGPYLAISRGVPREQALAAPITIKYQASATLQ